MKYSKRNMEKHAMEIISRGEKENIGKVRSQCDFREFGKFVGIWLVTAIVLFGSLVIITVVKGSLDVFRDTIKEVDALNMMFSLVLSALLEQIWSKEADKSWLYSITLGIEGILTLIGAMLFMAYSIIKITDPQKKKLQKSFELNVGYIIVSVSIVILGFLSRSLH